MKKYFLIIGGMLCLLLISYVIFSQTNIDLWGFSLPKKEIVNAIVYTYDDQYIISDPEHVMALVEEISKMERMEKINPTNFCIKEQPSKYKKLLLQTKDNSTYGGSFWKGNVIIQDCNGYYWRVTDDLFAKIELGLD